MEWWLYEGEAGWEEMIYLSAKEKEMKEYDVSYLRGGTNLSDALNDLPFKVVDRRSGEVLGVVVSASMLKPKLVFRSSEKVEKPKKSKKK